MERESKRNTESRVKDKGKRLKVIKEEKEQKHERKEVKL